ncbi:cysteine peptidase family C39 domain-containing protein [Aurantimicrobium photophilum]|uniref:Lactococcin-G-processing and transport ATP-binding protein LagD n=1 Tax=Aurantimicrobium photophilum TaxID=1987356 RepID=A0A2Z3RV27_9MICO|nr:cysteine peptidase family C39 domain-containing protein [Aurantimicrobium photophilum]AWR20699.1 Lactococcin-G-processing and transport ATP-binding protein LagD [Aurantimicrobium photophilum]
MPTEAHTAPKPTPQQLEEELAFTHSLRKNRVAVPTVLQMEVTECGAASLAMILAHYGKWETLENLRVACGVSRDGASAKSVVQAARQYGLEAKGVSISLESLANQTSPVIAYWDFAHFVVVEGTSSKGVFLNDPARGRVLISWEEADKSFTGLILRMKPTAEFTQGGSAPSTLASMKWRIQSMGSGIAFLLVGGLISAVPALLGPLALQAFVQQYLIAGLTEWAGIALMIMSASLGLGMLLGVWQSVVSRKLTQAMTVREAQILVRRALRLPTSFYAQRYPGEIAARLQLIDSVSLIVAGTIVPAAVGFITSIAVGFALFAFSWQLAVIALLAAGTVLLTVRAVQSKRITLSGRLGQENAAYAGATSYSLRSIETIKATGGEEHAMRTVLGHYAKVNSVNNDLMMSSSVLGMLPGLVSTIAGALVIGVGGLLVESGSLSVGAYIAVMALIPIFMRPIGLWSSAIDTLQQARTWITRLDDLLQQREEIVGTEQPEGNGVLEVKNVTFRYSPLAEPSVDSLSFRLEPGKRVALVGASGSGKSTAARLVVGLLHPTSGEVLLDGVPVGETAPAIRAQSVGYVEQDVVLFAGSIRDNITMFDDLIDTADVKAAAQAASIADEIESRPGGYESTLADGGRNMSGGQRQRLEIARVMLRKPGIVVLDEATSALDPIVEEQVMNSLLASGSGLLIIAHRLSTVRDCDEIIVMNKGVVVERGTHEELLSTGGHYAELVGSE